MTVGTDHALVLHSALHVLVLRTKNATISFYTH